MTDLLDCIHAALADSATPEAKQAGAHACCVIYAHLSPPPGVPISVPRAPTARINVDQVLDVAIAKLRSMVPADAEITTTSLTFPFLPSGGKAP